MIVTLGYALADDGTAEQPLLDRLDVALKVQKPTRPPASWLPGASRRPG